MLTEIARLETGGYRSTGSWTLGQVCDHLATVARLSLDEGVKPMPWVVRKLLARFFLRGVLKKRTMSAGMRAPKKLMPRDDATDANGLSRWRDVCRELVERPRETYFNPAFGPMDRKSFDDLQLLHAAHHLSFLGPLPV